MEVNDALVDKLANLARLKFDDSEKVAIKNKETKIIEQFKFKYRLWYCFGSLVKYWN